MCSLWEYTYLNCYFGFFDLEIQKYTYLNCYFGFWGFDIHTTQIDHIEKYI